MAWWIDGRHYATPSYTTTTWFRHASHSTEEASIFNRQPSVRPPSAVRQCPLPSDSPLTDGPTDHKKFLLTLPLSDVRRPTWGQYSGVNPIRCLLFRAFRANLDDRNNQLIILGHACKFALKCFALKRFALKCFALKCKHCMGLTPLYWPQVGRRTSDRDNVRRSFLWSDGWADGGQKET